MIPAPRWAVLIVTHNSAPVLAGLLDSLPAALAGVDDVRVAVVDNASADQTVALSAAHPMVDEVIETGRNAGFAAGVNSGFDRIQPAQGYLVLNADTRPEPGSIRRLVEALEQPGAGIAVPLLLDEAGKPLPSMRRDPSVLRALGEAVLGGWRASRFPALGEMVTDPARYSGPARAQWATGAAWLVSSRCHLELDGWDEQYFLYSEETDFAARARDRGFGVQYWPSARVQHLGGELSRSPYLWGIQAVNRVRFYRTRHGATATALFRAAVLVNELLRFASPVHRTGFRAVLTDRRPDERPPGPLRSRQDNTITKR